MKPSKESAWRIARRGSFWTAIGPFCGLTGYERSELIGQSHTILHPAENGSPPVTHFFAIAPFGKTGGRFSDDRLVTKSGAVKEVEIKASAIELGGRQLMHAFFRDMSEELRSRRERETSLTLMRLLNDRNHTHELIRNLTEFLHELDRLRGRGYSPSRRRRLPLLRNAGISRGILARWKTPSARAT